MPAKLIPFTQLSSIQQHLVLQWRNHPQVRRWMLNKEEISLQEHLQFLDKLRTDTTKEYFLVNDNGVDIGVIDFTDIDQASQSASIGLYANPQLHGVGRLLMDTLLWYGFSKLNLHTLRVSVYRNNTKAIHLYEKFQFIPIKKDDTLLYMELSR